MIASGAYPIDMHPATGAGLGFETLGKDHSYQIPYRAIVPSGLGQCAGGRPRHLIHP